MRVFEETTLNMVLPLVDLSFVRHEGRHDVFMCPFCCEDAGHLYINMETGLWDCKACSEVGNPLTLYAKVHGLSYKEAYKTLHHANANANTDAQVERHLRSFPPMISEAPIERRDAVYRDFLNALPLYIDHAKDLKRRGFSKKQVLENLYRSLPKGASEREKITTRVASQLDLTGVRGFRKRDEIWECFYAPGYLIPFMNAHGQIQAMQIRTDRGDPKYIFFGFRDSGIDNSTPVHVVNPDIARRTKAAWVTEGPLKADAASNGMEACFIASPGVSSWRVLIPVINDLEVSNIIQAFDRDQESKPEVAKCVSRFEESIVNKVHLLKAVWPQEWGNGIDDAQLKIRRCFEMKVTPSSLIMREIRETEVVLRKTADLA